MVECHEKKASCPEERPYPVIRAWWSDHADSVVNIKESSHYSQRWHLR
jgi:hypothetical protein